MLMESMTSPPGSCFFGTLTYRDEELTFADNGEPTLNTADLRNYIKRVRTELGAEAFRYFACGEYGDLNQRPHYHICFFGLNNVRGLRTVQSQWNQGFVSVSLLNQTRMAYTAQYCTKKITGLAAADIPEGSRLPEFARMSRRPALGDRYVLGVLAPALMTEAGRRAVAANGDVAASFRYDGKVWPLGARHRSIVRDCLGLGWTGADALQRTGKYFSDRPPPTAQDRATSQARVESNASRQKVYQSATRKV